jgi:transcriptional regulator of arginine metabolism
LKERRHAKILELIGRYNIDTQEELLTRLREEGFNVTQATVSRDIKELRLIKTPSPDGGYRYSAAKENTKDSAAKFYSLLSDSAVSIDCAGNIAVIKCLTGMAQAVCAAMDVLSWDNIVGTLSGDDTIFVLMRNENSAAELAENLNKIVR